MKTILCYGDSNTWGWNSRTMNPVTRVAQRFSRDERWPGVLRNELGEGYEIIEEGLNARTTVWDDPIQGPRSGKEYLAPCLESHRPIDLVILMLGTNDMKKMFSLSAFDVAAGAGLLVNIIKNSGSGHNGNLPKILLVCPPAVGKLKGDFAARYEGAEEKSRMLPEYYRRIANQHGCEFLNSQEIIVSNDIDGIHIDASEHEKLGRAISVIVRDMLK